MQKKVYDEQNITTLYPRLQAHLTDLLSSYQAPDFLGQAYISPSLAEGN